MEPTTFCPDCEAWIPESQFVAHRETEHPPSPTVLAVDGIRSLTAFGTDPDTED